MKPNVLAGVNYLKSLRDRAKTEGGAPGAYGLLAGIGADDLLESDIHELEESPTRFGRVSMKLEALTGNRV